jgi:hypothetical protein
MDTGCSIMLLRPAIVDDGLAAGFAGLLPHNLETLHTLLSLPIEVSSG